MATSPPATATDVIERAREALDADARIDTAYLFGSFARGEAHDRSDLDIGVLLNVPVPGTLRGPLADLRAAVEIACERECDLIDFRTAEPDLVHHAMRDAQILVDRNPRDRIDFQVRKMFEYWDLLPYLQLYRRYRPA